MARKEKLVTRTMVTTKVTAMVVDTLAGTVSNKVYEIAGEFKDDSKLLACIPVEDNEKAVSVVTNEKLETLYGMTESVFLANSHPIDKRSSLKSTNNN